MANSIVENLTEITPGMVLALIFLSLAGDGLRAAAEGRTDTSKSPALLRALDT
ncbi:MAG: hypothetical protein ACR2OY_07460 [Boseongicola sp.]